MAKHNAVVILEIHIKIRKRIQFCIQTTEDKIFYFECNYAAVAAMGVFKARKNVGR
jgi:hypothetical protein